MLTPLIAVLVAVAGTTQPLPIVEVTKDNTVIDRSCRVVIAPDTVIADTDGNGVIQIKPGSDGITVEFAQGSVLRGAAAIGEGSNPGWNDLKGLGIRLDGSKNVTLKNLAVRGYKVGVHASNADGLTVDGADLADIFRHRLKSTPAAEDGSDWLWPHKNDNNEWMTNYGAALVVEDTAGATVRNVKVRRAQNGIILDRATGAKVYDNDASFLSGWGLAMWRSTECMISRNAFDFCVRGHSEGVYNRGQDSAGILFFEQNSNNILAENSCTHGGDGIFGFAGLEALNGEGAPPGFDFTRRGCNDNLFIGNDLSYAPAHGLEMTFCFGNIIANNRFVENAICGIWGGYSQDTLVAENEFDGNGGMGYGLERGGVNIEHGADNLILANRFVNNKAGVHLWWDPHGDFETKNWGKANYRGVTGNVMAANTFIINDQHPFKNLRDRDTLLGLHLRDDSPGRDKVTNTRWLGNSVEISYPRGREMELTQGLTVITEGEHSGYQIPKYTPLGTSTPVGARPQLRGRDKIVMTEWGPWDHESPMVRLEGRTSEGVTYRVFGAPAVRPSLLESGPGTEMKSVTGRSPSGLEFTDITVSNSGAGVHGYRLDLDMNGTKATFRDALVSVQWDVRVWPWKIDPLKDLEGWRKEADGEGVYRATTGAIQFKYGFGGPKDWKISDQITRSDRLTGDRFGMIAEARVPLRQGRWRVKTLSDDGVRVFVDGNMLFERWDIHGPTPDAKTFRVDADREVHILVEHFENDGYSVLTVDLEPAE